MSGCCDPRGCQEAFGDGFARRTAKRYRRRGLDDTARRMVDFLAHDGLAGASVLEIGGGVGAISLELLRRGAASAMVTELSSAYDEQARTLASEAGAADAVQRRVVDVAATPELVDPADLVVLHRVVCCYPDYVRLLGHAADLCRGRIAFSHPPRNLVSRGALATQNAMLSLGRREFRTFAHPPKAMTGVLEARGLGSVYVHPGLFWQVQGHAR